DAALAQRLVGGGDSAGAHAQAARQLPYRWQRLAGGQGAVTHPRLHTRRNGGCRVSLDLIMYRHSPEIVLERNMTLRTTPTRLADRVSHDRAAAHAILDETFVCHLGLVTPDRPRVLPTLFVRDGDTLYLH